MGFSREIEIGPKLALCTEQEQRFVWAYVTGDGNATEAARDAGYVDNDNGSIRVRAHALMHRERVLEAIEECGRKVFRGLLGPAISANRKLIEDSKHPDHHKAVQSTLSRLGFTERTAVDVTVGGAVTVNHTDAALKDLRVLLGLGVPREKLVEIFGFSGLARYEKMLADQDRRALAGPVIEHEPAGG